MGQAAGGRKAGAVRRRGGRFADYGGFHGGAMALMAWGFTVEPEEAPPLVLMAVLIALPGVVIAWGAVRPVPADPGDPEGEGGRCEKLLEGRGW